MAANAERGVEQVNDKLDVLVIDDEEMIRELLRDCLESKDISVDEASDGREGLSKILDLHPRVVVSDVRMPQLNGYQILHEIRKNHPELASTRILLLTGLADAKYVSAAYRIGADDYITKPIDTKLFVNSVVDLLDAARSDEAEGGEGTDRQSEISWSELPAGQVSLASIANAVSGRIGNLPFNVGQVICLEVDEIRERLGREKWEKTRDKVTELVVGAAKRFCGPEDSYFRCPDGSVLFVFSGKDGGRAREVSEKISKRVNKSLFGWEEFEGVKVEGQVSEAGTGPPRNAFSPEEVVEALMPYAMRMGIAGSRTHSHGTDRQSESSESTLPLPAKAQKKEGLEFENVRGELLERFGAFGKKPIRFRYSPVWNVQRKFVGVFECAPSRESGSASTMLWNYDVLDRDHELSDIVELDVACLEHGLLGVTDHLIAGTPLLVCSSIHYETLASRMGREKILELLNQMPGELSDSVSLKVMYVPEGVPEIRLSEILGQIRGRISELSVEVSGNIEANSMSRLLNRFKVCGFRNIFVRMSPNPVPAELEKARSIVSLAKKFGLVPGVLGIDSHKLLLDLAYSGFVFFGGKIVGPSDITLPVPYALDTTNLETET